MPILTSLRDNITPGLFVRFGGTGPTVRLQLIHIAVSVFVLRSTQNERPTRRRGSNDELEANFPGEIVT
jgi:hypothetical protein